MEKKPQVIKLDQHGIDMSLLSNAVIQAIEVLTTAGFQAYVVGGGVRDLLLQQKPKDFDLATDATPNEIVKLIPRSRIIGKRFHIVHAYFEREIVEIATFRGSDKTSKHHQSSNSGMILRDNVYSGSIEEDAIRRDFTVNALFYDVKKNVILDYVDGMQDIKNKMIRMIGEPMQRMQEDPVRMLRAVRIASKLGFDIEENTKTAIYALHELIVDIPAARLFEEIMKIYRSGDGKICFTALMDFGLFAKLFPENENLGEQQKNFLNLVWENTDQRVKQGIHISPAFLFASILWYPLNQKWREYALEKNTYVALYRAMGKVLAAQQKIMVIPKRFVSMAKDIWLLQFLLEKRRGKRALRYLKHPKFRAGFDFLTLRAAAGETVSETLNWWREYIDEHDR